MHPAIGSHLTEEVLEKYALRHLPEAERDLAEDHLFVCEDCQRKFEAVEDDLMVGKAAARLEAGRESKSKSFGLFGWPAIPVWAGAAAALVLALGLPLHQRKAPPVEEVTLRVVRGAQLSAQAHDRTQLSLRIPAAEIPASASYRIDVADSRGNIAWQGSATSIGAALEAHVGQRLSRGKYWVRLYDASSPPVLLREFGLVVK